MCSVGHGVQHCLSSYTQADHDVLAALMAVALLSALGPCIALAACLWLGGAARRLARALADLGKRWGL
jgi:hypothetical protein